MSVDKKQFDINWQATFGEKIDFILPKTGKSFKVPLGRKLEEFDYDWDKGVWIDKVTGEVVKDNLVEVNLPMGEDKDD